MEPHIGERFGKLVVVGDFVSQNGRRWPCRCDCGGEVMVNITDLRKRRESGGGCSACVSLKRHGYGKSTNATYSKYQAMRQRCENANNKAYQNYGGRGIKVCESWMLFDNFLADMGECPGVGYSIDRIDVDGDYEPKNCKWSTIAEQVRNKRTNVKVIIDGVKYPTLKDAADAFGIRYATVRVRTATYGWSIERALKTPIDLSKRAKVKMKEAA